MKTLYISSYHSKFDVTQKIKVCVENDVNIDGVLKAVTLKMIKMESHLPTDKDPRPPIYPKKITIFRSKVKSSPVALENGIITPEGVFTVVRLDYAAQSPFEDNYHISISDIGFNEWLIGDELETAKGMELTEESFNEYLKSLKERKDK